MAQRKYLYTGRTSRGEEHGGFVVADSVAAATEQVRGLGLDRVAVLDDETSAQLRELWEREGGITSDAAFELRLRESPTALGQAWSALRLNAKWNVFVLAIVAALAGFGHPAIALVVAALNFAFLLLPARTQWQQNEIHRAYWRGDYAASERIARKLRGASWLQNAPAALLELDARIASARLKQGDRAGAHALLAPWLHSDKVPRAAAQAKVAHLYFVGREWDAYVEAMEAVHRERPEDPTRVIDLGQTLARMGGDPARARQLLESVDTAAFGDLPLAFVAWGRGVVSLREGDDATAVNELGAAVAHLQAQAGNPMLWGAIAIATGYLAVALARTGRRDLALSMHGAVAAIVASHAEDPLLDMLRAERLAA